MKESWIKAVTAFRTRTQKINHTIRQSTISQWLTKQMWFNWISSQRTVILTIIAIFAFAGYAFLIRNELTVGENQGNIKFVAIKSKDTQSNGYKQNIRSNLTINGSIPDKEAFLRKEWGEYGGGIPIPIYIADAATTENQTLEIQNDGPIKSLQFEYSSYDIGGILQIYLDDVLYTQINTYNGKELVYKPITLTFDQHLAINKSNGLWWGQLAVFGISLILFIRYNLSKKVKKRTVFGGLALILATAYGLKIILSVASSPTFVLSNTSYHFSSALTTFSFFIVNLIVASTVLAHLAKAKLRVLGQLIYVTLLMPVPFLAHYLLETPVSTDSYLDAATTPTNLLILTIVWFCFSFVLTSFKLGGALFIITTLIMGIVNKILIHLRATPLLAYFFLQIFDGLKIAENTAFTLASNIPPLVLLACAYISVLFLLPSFRTIFKTEAMTAKINEKWPKLAPFNHRLVIKALTAVFGLFFTLFIARPMVYQIANKVDMELRFFSMQKTYYQYGFALSFVRFEEVSHVTKPEEYSTQKVEDILAQYPKKDSSATTYPNIIVIQNEALTDYSRLTNLTFNTDPMAFIHSLSDNAITGTTYMSVLGGATANSEYEVLTGNSLAILPPNSFPYQQLIQGERNSLARTLKSYGYKTIGTHPYVQNFYRRNLVYQYLGFDEAYFNDSKPSISDLIEVETSRTFVSDKSLYDLSQKFIKESEEPVFNFIVTMQGHETYGISEEQSPRTVTTTNAEANSAMTDYLSNVKVSDQAFKGLVKSLQQTDEPTIVVMYGDHQPNITPTYFAPYLDSSDPSSQYQTPFVLWANFDIEESSEIRMSANYITPYLMNTLSQTDYALPQSSYYQFLSKVQSEIPILTTWGHYDSSGTYSENAPTSELYQQYQYIEYNNVVDKNSIDLTEYYQ